MMNTNNDRRAHDLLLVSQPNSGSTWFSNCIAKANPAIAMYPKEFFNPVLNQKYYEALAPHLGCELYPCIGNIAKELDAATVDKILTDSWHKEPYNFTKEVFFSFCAEVFSRRFHTFGVTRDISYTFPPLTVRVVGWYVACFHSIMSHGLADCELKGFLRSTATDLQRQAVAGWQLMRWRMDWALDRIGCEVFDFDQLMTASEDSLAEDLAKIQSPLIDPVLTARQIVESRVSPTPADMKPHALEWRETLGYHSDLVRRFEQPFMNPVPSSNELVSTSSVAMQIRRDILAIREPWMTTPHTGWAQAMEAVLSIPSLRESH